MRQITASVSASLGFLADDHFIDCVNSAPIELSFGAFPSDLNGRQIVIATGTQPVTIQLNAINMFGKYPGARFSSGGEGYLVLRVIKNKCFLMDNDGVWFTPSPLFSNGLWNDNILWDDKKYWEEG